MLDAGETRAVVAGAIFPDATSQRLLASYSRNGHTEACRSSTQLGNLEPCKGSESAFWAGQRCKSKASPEKLRELTLEGMDKPLKAEKDILGKSHGHAVLDMLIRCPNQRSFCCYLRLVCTKDSVENRQKLFILIPVRKCGLPALIACRKSIIITAPYLAG